MTRFFDFLAPKAVKAARYRELVFRIFYRSDMVFDVDNGDSRFDFNYYLGRTAQPFGLDSVKQYLFRYASHAGYSVNDGADGFDTTRTATGGDADASNAVIPDFTAYFLLEVLQLRMLPKK